MTIQKKHFKFLNLFVVLLLNIYFSSCQENLQFSKVGGDESAELGVFFEIDQIRDYFELKNEKGEPLAQAEVLLGLELNKPHTGNFLKTDGNGRFKFPQQWKERSTVTLQAPGYIRASYLDVDPKGFRIFYLKPLPKNMINFELSGVTTGFQTKARDGLVDFAITLPMVKPEALFQFNLDMILSPYTDVMTVLGRDINVPSNVTLPEQKESYILPVTLNKPQYRLGFVDPGSYQLVTLSGQFPIKPVFDAFRNGSSFSDLINYFNMQSVSSQQVTIQSAQKKLNLPIGQKTLNQSAQLTSPSFDQKTDVVFGVSVGIHPEGLYPIDVKRLSSAQKSSLKVVGDKYKLLSMMRKQSEMEGKAPTERMSASLEDWKDSNQEIAFLPLMKNPSLISPLILEIDRVMAPSQFYEGGAFYQLATIKQTKNNKGEVTQEERTPLWEVYGSTWESRLVLPSWPGDLPIKGKKRWSVSLFASRSQSLKVTSFKTLVEGEMTHVTHANVDFE